MPSDKKTDGIKRTIRVHRPKSPGASTPASEIFQQFSQQLDLMHATKGAAKTNQAADDIQPDSGESNAYSAQDWEQEDIVQTMINSLLAGAFDENVALHADNLAEKLIERQRELDRRESQLNLRSAELENKVRQARLDNVPMQAASEIEKTIEAELAVYYEAESGKAAAANEVHYTSEHLTKQADFKSVDDPSDSAGQNSADQSSGENIVTFRLDKFSESQRAPYSLLNKRWKRYIQDTKADHSPNIHGQQIRQPATEVRESARQEVAKLAAIRDLTKRAAAVRQRGEEVENMYAQLHEMFSEMLRQQTTLRQIIMTIQAGGKNANQSELEAAKSTLDRLTVGLSRVGHRHFLLPEEPADAA